AVRYPLSPFAHVGRRATREKIFARWCEYVHDFDVVAAPSFVLDAAGITATSPRFITRRSSPMRNSIFPSRSQMICSCGCECAAAWRPGFMLHQTIMAFSPARTRRVMFSVIFSGDGRERAEASQYRHDSPPFARCPGRRRHHTHADDCARPLVEFFSGALRH